MGGGNWASSPLGLARPRDAVVQKKESYHVGSLLETSLVLRCVLVVSACLTVVPLAEGQQTDTWVGNSDPTWSNSANWTTTGTTLPPLSGDSLVFGNSGTSGVDVNNNLTNLGFTVSGITFNAGAAAFVIGNGTTAPNVGNPFTLAGSIVNSRRAWRPSTIRSPWPEPSLSRRLPVGETSPLAG